MRKLLIFVLLAVFALGCDGTTKGFTVAVESYNQSVGAYEVILDLARAETTLRSQAQCEEIRDIGFQTRGGLLAVGQLLAAGIRAGQLIEGRKEAMSAAGEGGLMRFMGLLRAGEALALRASIEHQRMVALGPSPTSDQLLGAIRSPAAVEELLPACEPPAAATGPTP